MTAILAAELTAATAFLLLLYIAHLLDADDTRTVPIYTPAVTPEVLRAARLEVAAEMAAVRAQIPVGRPPIGHGFVVGHRKLVSA